MTTGQILKKRLGLENLEKVKVARFVVSSYKVIGAFYDSNRDFLVTNYRINRSPRVVTVFHGTDLFHGTNKYVPLTPAIDIEDYNGTIRGALVIPIDLAGDRFIDEDKFTKVFESIEEKEKEWNSIFIPKETLNEITLYDLADKSSMSKFTQKWKKDHTRLQGGGNKSIKLVDCLIDESDKSVTFQFLSEATELGNKKPSKKIDSPYRFYRGGKKEIDPETMKLKRNTGKVYELQIKILDALEWIKAFEGEKIGRKEMKEILEVSDIQVFSTSPSFQLQGMAYWNTQLGSSIHPENRAPQRWDKFHGEDYFLDKHLGTLFMSIKFFLNPMASQLTGKLRQRGLI